VRVPDAFADMNDLKLAVRFHHKAIGTIAAERPVLKKQK
jgi:hypothetical protein